MKSCVGIIIFLIFISLIIKPLISALLDIFMTWDSIKTWILVIWIFVWARVMTFIYFYIFVFFFLDIL